MQLLNFVHRRCNRKQSPIGNWVARRISKKLQLNEPQQVKLSSLQNAIFSSQSYVADIQKDRSTMLEEIFSVDGFNRDSALHYLNIPRLAFEEQAPAVIDSLGEFYQCLNHQQREQFRSMLQKHHQQKRCCWH